MGPKERRPGSNYYEDPYIPSEDERSDYQSIPLRPVEAHTLLVNNAGNLSEADKRALRAIVDGDYHPDQEVDFLTAGKEEMTLDGGYHDDDDDDWR
jgi:hypothetical protein